MGSNFSTPQQKVKEIDIIKLIDINNRNSHELDEKIKSVNVKLSYSCIDEKCNFTEVINEIVQSAELKSIGVKNISETVVKLIDKNQNTIFPSKSRGYFIESNGITCLYLKNKTYNTNKSNYYGVINLNKIEKELF